MALNQSNDILLNDAATDAHELQISYWIFHLMLQQTKANQKPKTKDTFGQFHCQHDAFQLCLYVHSHVKFSFRYIFLSLFPVHSVSHNYDYSFLGSYLCSQHAPDESTVGNLIEK